MYKVKDQKDDVRAEDSIDITRLKTEKPLR